MLAAAETITSGELRRHVDVLADDSFEGREGGSRGGRAAGGYLVAELQKLGLKPLGEDGGYFQSFSGGHRNVLALLEGSDPKLKHQYVMLGAHYDHVGYGSRSNSYGPTGYIHNGADDNASGVSALLEVVQAFTSLPEPPKRSVIFALWDGEEKGLLGSKHWLSRPTVPAKNVVLYVNLDMVGRMRNSRVEVYGTRTSYGLRSLISQANATTGLILDFTWEMKEDSDHYPFYDRSIPTLMLHTGLHENYHRPSDDAHLINAKGMEQISKLTFALLHSVADSDRSLPFRVQSRRENPAARRALEEPIAQPPPRLGLQWKVPSEGEKGVVAARVTPGMPAEKAGIRVGDRLLRFGGRPIEGDVSLRGLVLAAQSPVEIELERPGESEPKVVTVELRGSPVRLGITWREDSAEPGTALLTQVVYGSPAHRAGLRERDRIYEVAGQKFRNSEELLRLATSSPSPIELLVERAGMLKQVKLELPEAAAE